MQSTEDQLNNNNNNNNLPNFGSAAREQNPMFTQSAYTPSTQTLRMNQQLEQQQMQNNNGQMFRSSTSPMHIDLGAAQQQFQHTQGNQGAMGYQDQSQQSPFTPPRKHPLISNNNTSNNGANKMRGYTPTTAQTKVPGIPIQSNSAISNAGFGSTIQREYSPYSREPMITYNKALDSVAILGNEFEQTIKAFENVQDELNVWRERCQKLTEMYENQNQEEKQEYFNTQQKLEQSYREIEKLTIIVEGVNQKLEFNSQKMKTLERKCQDYSTLEQKYNQLKQVSREQDAKVKVLETEIASAREIIEIKDREITDLEVYKREYADISEKLSQLEKENMDLKNNIQDRDKTLEQQLNTIEQLSNTNNQLESENNQLKDHIAEFEKQVEIVHDEIDVGLMVASSHMNYSNQAFSQNYMVEHSQHYIASQNEQILHQSQPHNEQSEIPSKLEEQQYSQKAGPTEEEGEEEEEYEVEEEEYEEEEEDEDDEEEEDDDEDDDEEEEDEDENNKIQQQQQQLINYQIAEPQHQQQQIYQQHPDDTVVTSREQQFTQEPQNTLRNAQNNMMYMTQQQQVNQQNPQLQQNQYYSQYQQPQQQQQLQNQNVYASQNNNFYQQQQQQNTNSNMLGIPPDYMMDVQNPLQSSVDQSMQGSVKSATQQQQILNDQSQFQQSQSIPQQFGLQNSSPRKGSFGIQSVEQQAQVHQQILLQYSQGQQSQQQQQQQQGVSSNNLDTLHSQHSSVANPQSQFMNAQQIEEYQQQQQQQYELSVSQNVQGNNQQELQQLNNNQGQIQQNISASAKLTSPNNQNNLNRMAQTTYTPNQQQQQQQQQYREFHRQECIQLNNSVEQPSFQQDNNNSFQQPPINEVGQSSFVPQNNTENYQVDGANSQQNTTYISPTEVSQRRVSDLNVSPANDLRQTSSVVIQQNQEFNQNAQFYSQKLPQFQVSPKQAHLIKSNQNQMILAQHSIQQSQYIQESVEYSQNQEEEEENKGNTSEYQQQQQQDQQYAQQPPAAQEYNSTLSFQNQFISEHMMQSREQPQFGHSSQELVVQGYSHIDENLHPHINNATSVINVQTNQNEQQQQDADPNNVNINKLGRGSLKVGYAVPQNNQQAPQFGRGSVQLNANQPAVNVKNLQDAHQQAQQNQVKQTQSFVQPSQPTQKAVLDEIQEENPQSNIVNAGNQSINESQQQQDNSQLQQSAQPHEIQNIEYQQQSSISNSVTSSQSNSQRMQQPPVQVSQQQENENTILDQTEDEEPLQISASNFVRQQQSVQQAPNIIMSIVSNVQQNIIDVNSAVNQANVCVGNTSQLNPDDGSQKQLIVSQMSATPIDASQPLSNQSQQQQIQSAEQNQQRQQFVPAQNNISQAQSVYIPNNNKQAPAQQLNNTNPIAQSQPLQPTQLQSFGPAQNQTAQQLQQSQNPNQSQLQQSEYVSQQQQYEEVEDIQLMSQDGNNQNRSTHSVQGGRVQIDNQQLVQQLQQGQNNILQTQSVYVPSQKKGNVQNMAQSQPLVPNQKNLQSTVNNQIVELPQEEELASAYLPQQTNSVVSQVSPINQQHQPQFISTSQVQQPTGQQVNQGQLFYSQAQRPVQGLQQQPIQAQSQQSPSNNQVPVQDQSIVQSQQQQLAQSQQVNPNQQAIQQFQQQQGQNILQTQSVYVAPQKNTGVQNMAQSQPLVANQRNLASVNNQIVEQPQEEEEQQSVYQGQQGNQAITQNNVPQKQYISASQVQQQGQPQNVQQTPFYSQVQRPVQGLQQQQQQPQSIQQSQIQQQQPTQTALGVSQQQPQQRINQTQSVFMGGNVQQSAAPPAQPSILQSSVESQPMQPRETTSHVVQQMSGVSYAIPSSNNMIPQQQQQISQTATPQQQQRQQSNLPQFPNHLQTQSYYIPQQQQSAISFSGISQPSQQVVGNNPQFVQSQYEGQQQQNNTLNSIPNVSMVAIAPNSQVIGSFVDPTQQAQKKKTKGKKKNMNKSEAPGLISEQGVEESYKVKKAKKTKKVIPSEEGTGAGTNMTQTTPNPIQPRKLKKKSVQGSTSSIKKSKVATPSENMSKTSIPLRQQSSQPQIQRTTSQNDSAPLSPPSIQNKQISESQSKSQTSQQRPAQMSQTAFPGNLQRKSISMISSQSKEVRTVVSGQNNMLNKVIAMKNQLLEKNTEIDALKQKMEENIQQIQALSSENTLLNEQNAATKEELEQIQKQLQENFEFHKSEIDNLRQEYENTIAPLLQEKQNLEESNLALSKQCEAFDIALQNSDEEKFRAIRELINEKEQLQNFSEAILKEKDLVRSENLALKDDQSRRIKMENSLIKDNEDQKNLIGSQQKDIETWKIKYKNLKKEINGLRLQFDSYKNQVLHEIQSQFNEKSTNFQGVLTSIKKKYHENGDSVLSSAREMIIQQDQQENGQYPPQPQQFTMSRQSFNHSQPQYVQQTPQQQQQQFQQQQQQQQYHYLPQQPQQLQQQGSHQKSHSMHSYAPVHTTEFIPNQNQQNDEQFLNNLKYKINALKQTQAEQEALQIKSQKQLQQIQIHSIQQQFLSGQKNNSQQLQDNSVEQSSAEHQQEDSIDQQQQQQQQPIEFQIEQLILLKNQYEQALGRVNQSMSPQKHI